MKTHELIKMCSNQIIDVINNRWGICREGNGSKYVNSPMPEKEYFTDIHQMQMFTFGGPNFQQELFQQLCVYGRLLIYLTLYENISELFYDLAR